MSGIWHWRIIGEEYEVVGRWQGNDLVWYSYKFDKDTKIAHITRDSHKDVLPGYRKRVDEMLGKLPKFTNTEKKQNKIKVKKEKRRGENTTLLDYST